MAKINKDKMLESDQHLVVNYKWIFIVVYADPKGTVRANQALTSFGPDYVSAKNFLVIRMKNKKRQLLQIFGAKALEVHFAYYPDYTEVPPEKYGDIAMPPVPSPL